MNYCLNCKKETKNPKYCSKSCSAKHTNVLFPKRKPTKICKTCLKVSSFKGYYCSKECKPIPKLNINTTLQDLIYKEHHKSSAFAYIRENARKIGKNLGFKKCSKCNYDKHFEVCHINPISSFPLTTLISTINSSLNLIPLCPNCHWELDHNL